MKADELMKLLNNYFAGNEDAAKDYDLIVDCGEETRNLELDEILEGVIIFKTRE